MTLKTILQMTAAIAALIATPALAADMAVKVAPRGPAPAAANWTGCYVNGGVGYGLFRQEQTTAFSDGTRVSDASTGGSGWLGTVGGGCDFQFSPGSGWGNFVVGVLADYSFMDLRSHFQPSDTIGIGTEKESSAVAAGGRIGYLVTPQILAYINGGWSSTRFAGVTFKDPRTGTPLDFTLPAHTFKGGFIGGGTEVAVAAFPGLYWRNEYRLASYRAADIPFLTDGVPDGSVSHESKTVQTITTSLVWKFGATAAPAADVEGKAPPRSPLAVKAAPRGPAPLATTWTGCYLNGGAGYGLFRQEQNTMLLGRLLTADATTGGSGWLGTIGGGCDYQFSPGSGWGNWVGGVLADYDFMDLRAHLNPSRVGAIGTEKESSAVAAGGRIGYLATPQILAYVNGGWSATRFDGVSFNSPVTNAPEGFTLPAHNFNGGFIGGGTEVAVAAFPGLYWRNEYRLASYRTATLPFSLHGAPDGVAHESKTVQTITTSIVWKFH